jgi:large subunit ribosomal protein L24
MRRIKTGDEVVVIGGRDKGRRGRVVRIVDEERVVVEGINVVKKHQKANPMRSVAGGILEIEAPIHVSNVMLFNPATNKPDRVGFRTLDDGRKVRYFKSNKEVVDL